MSDNPLRGLPASEKRNRLLELVREHAYMEGDFTLSSGAKSSFYLDCRRVSLYPAGALLIGGFVLDLMKKLGISVVGGPTLAADPIVGAAVALSPLWDWPVEGFIVRKAAKEHGTGKLIEGRLPEGKPVLIVEDTITSAGSVLRAVEAVREAGSSVEHVWALVDRQAGGREALAEAGIELHAMFTLDDIRSGGTGEDRSGIAPWQRHFQGWKESPADSAPRNDVNGPRAIIFDMDGVLINSEEFICRAAIEFLAERGVQAKPEDFTPFIGAGEDRFIGGVAEKYGLSLDLEEAKLRTYTIYRRLISGRLGPLPGAVEFIQAARQKGIRLAVASSADRMKVEINLKEIGLSAETFDAIICGQDVAHKKPDPEIFLLAAERLGVSPRETLVVEDAVNGIQAARAGGFRCLGITTSFSPEHLPEADWHAPDLASVPAQALDWS